MLLPALCLTTNLGTAAARDGGRVGREGVRVIVKQNVKESMRDKKSPTQIGTQKEGTIWGKMRGKGMQPGPCLWFINISFQQLLFITHNPLLKDSLELLCNQNLAHQWGHTEWGQWKDLMQCTVNIGDENGVAAVDFLYSCGHMTENRIQ